MEPRLTISRFQFRVFDPQTRKFSYFDIRGSMGQLPLDIEDYYINQFTGLLDKNGNKIFEGDFVQMRESIDLIIFKFGCFRCFDANMAYTHMHDNKGRMSNLAVVGNKFEGDQPDPEVLGKYSPK